MVHLSMSFIPLMFHTAHSQRTNGILKQGNVEKNNVSKVQSGLSYRVE